MTIHATITAYKGSLIIDLIATKSIENEVATSLDGPTRIGQVIMNTGKHLGVSKEAYQILKTIKRGRDDLGDINWFVTTNNNMNAHAFSWLGGPKQIVNPEWAEGGRAYVLGAYVEIPNDVPQAAAEAIDRAHLKHEEKQED
jgi:hypothetical protein